MPVYWTTRIIKDYFKNIKEVGHVVWTDMPYMGIYLIFSIALALILAGKQHLDWRELHNPI